jgi:death-on-curing protein
VTPRWTWVSLETVLAVHARQLSEHGGAVGIRELALVESALMRPLNLASYGEPDAAALAAAYLAGPARNHGLVDGNKRTAWVNCRLFLGLNGVGIRFDPLETVRTVEAVAAGTMTEEAVASWFRSRIAGSAPR